MREKAEQHLKYLKEQKELWEFYIQHARWIDNGRGGCVNKDKMLTEINAKIEVIMYLLN